MPRPSLPSAASPPPEGLDDPTNEGEVAWGCEPIEKLAGTALEWSTITEAEGKIKVRGKKTCWLCGFAYHGGPDAIRCHLDLNVKKRNVAACKPLPENKARYALVAQEIRRRTSEDRASKDKKAQNDALKQQGRAVATGLGLTPDQLAAKQAFDLMTPDDVTNAWVKVLVKKALPIDIFDDEAFREAIVTTAKCGVKRLVVGRELQIPKRRKVTTKVLPKFDTDLDANIRQRMQAVAKFTGVTLISDGWSSCANRPIINALAASPLGTYFMKAVDTSGETKDAVFIADFMCNAIEEYGADKVVAVCMDGACKSSFEAIEEVHEHIFCYICPTHSLDNFMKNVCSGDKQTINVRGYSGPTLEWGEPIFSDSFTKVTQGPPRAPRPVYSPPALPPHPPCIVFSPHN